jgi:hypothetical protein
VARFESTKRDGLADLVAATVDNGSTHPLLRSRYLAPKREAWLERRNWLSIPAMIGFRLGALAAR